MFASVTCLWSKIFYTAAWGKNETLRLFWHICEQWVKLLAYDEEKDFEMKAAAIISLCFSVKFPVIIAQLQMLFFRIFLYQSNSVEKQTQKLPVELLFLNFLHI